MVTPQTWLEEVTNCTEGHLSTDSSSGYPELCHSLTTSCSTQWGGSTRRLHPPSHGATSGAKGRSASSHQQCGEQVLSLQPVPAGNQSQGTLTRDGFLMLEMEKCPFKTRRHQGAGASPCTQLLQHPRCGMTVPTYFL